MGIDALLLHLQEDAELEASRISREAEERSAGIAARAGAETDRRRAMHLERLALGRRQAIERKVAGARAEARARYLSAREALLERVFAMASASLERMPAARYAASVPRLIAEAARFLEGGPAVLRCPPDALAATEEATRGLPDLAVEPADLPAGVVARSADGRVTVDNTLRAILDRRRAALAIGLAARIEGGPDAVG